jgi:hypothetical protein
MALSQRLRILLGGWALVVLTGVVAACAFFPGAFSKFLSLGLLVAAAVVFAPVSIILAGIASLSTGSAVAVLLVAGGVLTVFAFPIYPILRLRRFGWVSVIGLIAWIICQMYMVVEIRLL